MNDDVGQQYPRFEKNLVAAIHSPYLEKRVETNEVSLDGLTICNAERYYDDGEILYIELALEKTGSIYCNARVLSIYPHHQGASTYKLSLQFVDMSDVDKEKLRSCMESG